MPTVNLSPIFNGWQGFSINGLPLAGGFINTYVAGTVTPLATYTTNVGNVANSNPIQLDASGHPPFEIWLIQGLSYKFVVTDALGLNPITYDNITGIGDQTALLAYEALLASSAGSSQIGFIQSGGVATDLQTRGRLEVWSFDFGHSPAASAIANDAALLAAITAVFNAGGGTIRVSPGTYQHISVIFNWTAGISVNIVGSGQKAVYLQKSGATTTPVLDLSVNIGVLDVYSTISDMTIIGNAKAHHGLRATRLANITTRNLGTQACDVGVEKVGCLVDLHERPEWSGNNIGMRARKNTAGGNIFCNQTVIVHGSIRGNSTFGIDLGDSSNMKLDSVKLDTNGTAGNTATGGMMVRDTVDDESGFSQLLLENCYFEANLGRTFQTENATGLDLTMINVLLASAESNRSANIGAIHTVRMTNCQAASPGDTVVIGACASSVVEGGVINTLTDSSTRQTRQPYTNASGLQRDSVTSFTVGASGLRIDSTVAVKNNLGTFTQGDTIVTFQDGAGSGNVIGLYATNGANGNAAATCLRTGVHSVNGRSINSGGTINAAGADYAEYIRKAEDCGVIPKGAIVGITADGFLTDRWANAVAFMIKSTNPSLVGGDGWGSNLEGNELEAARQQVDRIAFAGQVPVNVWGAQPGDYIVPMQGADGGITAIPVTSATFDQYRQSVGRVIAIEADGRARIIVKVS